MGEPVRSPAIGPPARPGFGGQAIRLVLSFFIVAGMLTIVYLAVIARVFMEKSSGLARENVVLAGDRGSSHGGWEEVEAPWPRYPGCRPSAPRAMTINGVRTTSEDWDTSSSAAEVLGFLKEQMEARGWHDCTEEAYGLQPERRPTGEEQKGLQNQDYISVYSATVDSCLVMRDRSRFMQVSLEPGDGRGRIRVSLFAAETPTYEEFSQRLAWSLGGGPGRAGGDRVAEFSERSGLNSYNTRMISSDLDPEPAARGMIEEMRAGKWQTVAMSMQLGRDGECCWAVLQRGRQYAYLAVAAGDGGHGSSAMITEATEE